MTDAYKKAVDYLTRREHCEKELITKLASKFGEEEAIKAIKLLQEKKYQSNMRYACNILTYKSKRGYGYKWIRSYLQSMHISDTDLELALEEVAIDWNKYFYEYAHKKSSFYKDKKSLINHLISRGHDPSLVLEYAK
jgi:SOS response regulatory protein OraA/RecX